MQKVFAVKVCADVRYNSAHHSQRKEIVSSQQDIKYRYKTKHTGTQWLYATRPHPDQYTPKVMFPFSSQMKIENLVNDETGMYGVTQHYAYIPLNPGDKSESVIKFLLHPFTRWLRHNTRDGKSWERMMLKNLPAFDFTLDFSSARLYDAIGLTPEEIAYIEDNVRVLKD